MGKVWIFVLIVCGVVLTMTGLICYLEAQNKREDSSNIREIHEDDAALQIAARNARSDWKKFTDAFAHRKANEQFFVKSPFTQDGKTEHMWVSVQTINGDNIVGTLQNDPVEVRKMKNGQRVLCSVSEIEDWMFVNHGKINGLYSKIPMQSQPQKK
ncbi:MAG TPA: DUF2314 domain-containing protein [Planktothrix sp.]|jgi:uncharacterized protein YegJ (DUF2314 family)